MRKKTERIAKGSKTKNASSTTEFVGEEKPQITTLLRTVLAVDKVGWLKRSGSVSLNEIGI